MNEKKEKKLVEKYLNFFQKYKKTVFGTINIDCEDGWFDILDQCLNKIKYFCELCSKNDNKTASINILQIKEKFSVLRIHFITQNLNDLEKQIFEDIIFSTEKKSSVTCEITGAEGEKCERGRWYKTLCYEEARKGGYTACRPEIEKYWKHKDEKLQRDENNNIS